MSEAISPNDPIIERRAKVGRLAALARRAGWSLWGVAVIAFVVGLLTDLPPALVVVVIASLVAGSVLLLPAIVIGFGVSAAERDERGGSSYH